MERWVNLTESWDPRIARMAGAIKPNSRVLDLGCGIQKLREYLPAGCSYTPCDVTQRTPDTIVCDFNQGELPPPRLL